MSDVRLGNKPDFRAYFEERNRVFGERDRVSAGVCSIQVRDEEPPWIVCPRRLLALGKEKAGTRVHQRENEQEVMRLLDHAPGSRLGVWPEVKVKYSENVEGVAKTFDYTFDYIVMPIGRRSASEMETATGEPWHKLRRTVQSAGYSLARREGKDFIEDAPMGVPGIIEIMTSSTSGGNRERRTTIPLAFEDALLEGEHRAPGINYRQVWARMVSQLVPKSEAALAWGGKTLWIVQDHLVNYIRQTTRLDVHQFLSDHADEVNILSFSYGQDFGEQSGIIELGDEKLYAGPISQVEEGEETQGFQDIIRAPVSPSLQSLMRVLATRAPANQVVVSDAGAIS